MFIGKLKTPTLYVYLLTLHLTKFYIAPVHVTSILKHFKEIMGRYHYILHLCSSVEKMFI